MKIDLTKIKTKDIDGKVVKQEKGNVMYKHIANIMYIKCKNLDLVDIAMNINKGVAVEMEVLQVSELRMLVADPANGLLSFARKAVLEYLDKVEETDKKKKAKK